MLSKKHILAELEAIQMAWSGSVQFLANMLGVSDMAQIQASLHERLKLALAMIPPYFWVPSLGD